MSQLRLQNAKRRVNVISYCQIYDGVTQMEVGVARVNVVAQVPSLIWELHND